jgi:hypothetical protein
MAEILFSFGTTKRLLKKENGKGGWMYSILHSI